MNMKRLQRIVRSMLVIAFVAAVISLGTHAYLYDSEQSSGNTLTAATLDLKIQDPSSGQWVDDPEVPKLDAWCSEAINNLKPGDHRSISIPIWNAGNCRGTTSLTIKNVQNYGGALTEAERVEDPANGGGLGRLVWTEVKYDNGSIVTPIDAGWLDDFSEMQLLSPEILPSDGYGNWVLELDYADYGSPDNLTQGDYLSFDIMFDLKQQ